MSTIEPTVGRVVWFTPGPDFHPSIFKAHKPPFAAHVAHVNEDGAVNVMVIGPAMSRPLSSIRIAPRPRCRIANGCPTKKGKPPRQKQQQQRRPQLQEIRPDARAPCRP